MGKRRKSKKKIYHVWWIVVFLIVIAIWFFRYDIKNQFVSHPQDIKSISWYQSQLSGYSLFGLDVSEYQNTINWETVTQNSSISFVFIRSTAGKNKLDKKYNFNWQEAHKVGLTCGAYHYYRPNENSLKQANNFIKHVTLKPGDLPPILDIEKYSTVQSTSSLKNGVLKFLTAIESHYGVTPIIYTYKDFYNQQIANDSRFDKYPVWLAWYNISENPGSVTKQWIFWQFTDRGSVDGIETAVDINVFYGKQKKIEDLLIE